MNIPQGLDNYFYEILDQAKNGIAISDPNQEDNPIIYINKAFTDIFEYTFEEVVGKNCRFLQGSDIGQSGAKKIKEIIKEESSATVVLRNYTKSSELVYNELTVSPIFDKSTGKIKYFLGVQRDVTNDFS